VEIFDATAYRYSAIVFRCMDRTLWVIKCHIREIEIYLNKKDACISKYEADYSAEFATEQLPIMIGFD
jgi:hypothetical protein